jgi:hypothetical protein
MLLALVALPWLQGFQVQAVADHPSRKVGETLSEYRALDPDCVASAYGGLSLDTPSGKVLASFSQGMFLFDKNHQLQGQVPGFQCAGSADELVSMAVGDAFLDSPVIALAATSGGRAESITWLGLYKVSKTGTLDPVFIGTVERHDDHQTHTGTVTIVPGGLIYHAPEGATSVWTYDGTRYVQQGNFPVA